MKGTHIVTDICVRIQHPIKIYGAGRDQTIVKGGGFDIRGMKEEGKNVVLKDMTISKTSGNGVVGLNGLSWLCDSLSITQCRGTGVLAVDTKGILINCVITKCRGCGIRSSYGGLIELKGSQTKVDGNGRGTCSGYSINNYGLHLSYTSSIIHLHFPLTKESVSTNNHDGRNYGGKGTINQNSHSMQTLIK